MYNSRLLFIFLQLILFLMTISFSYSTNLNLDLIEGGCVGYENASLELYYDNGSIVNSSNFEIIVYNGPIQGLGVLDSFTADKTPYNIMFNEDSEYLYEIETNNNTLYTGLEGFISIYGCESNSQNSNEDNNFQEVTLEFESKVSITFLTNSTDTTDFIFQSTTAPNNLLSNKLEEQYARSNFEIEYYNLNYEGGDVVENTSLESELNMSFFNETQDEWVDLEDVDYSLSFPILLAIKNISLNTNDSSNNDEINESNNSEVENSGTSNSQGNSNQANTPNSQYPFEENNENNVVMYLIIGGGVLFIIIIILVIKSISKSKKNKQFLNEAPLTLTQTKIMTYCDNYKHKYEPKEIVEQLVEQGYDKQVVINTLWKYIEKEKKQN